MEGQPDDVTSTSNEEEIQSDEESKTNAPNIEHISKSSSHTVYLAASVPTWKYLTRCKKFSDVLDSILSQHEIVCELDTERVSIKGQAEDKLIEVKKQLEELIKEFQEDTFIIPPLEPDVHSKAVSFLDDHIMHNEITYYFHSPTDRICLTGKKKQIEDCIGVLQEIFGVTGALPFENGEAITKIEMSGYGVTSNMEVKHFDQDPQLNISPEPLADSLDDKLYHSKATDFIEIEDDALIVDENIWTYMEKHNSYSKDIKQIKEKTGLITSMEILDCSEEIDRRIRLTFTGPDESCIHSSMLETKSIIERCQETEVKTCKVQCPDIAVHQRITKHLKAINRQLSYVSVNPELISITGTKEEIESCLEKLKNYGLQYVDPAAPCKVPELFCPTDNEIDHTSHADFDQDDDDQPHQYEHYRQLPVPVEEDLWFYIDNRCRQQLDDLKKGYSLQITPDRADTQGLVNITLASHSDDMLDCGQEAFITLILQLREQIVTGVMNTASLEDLPPGLQDMLQQQFNNMNSLVVLKGNKIITIGPNHESMMSQQIVFAFMQNIVADARRMGYDTSKFDQAIGLKEWGSSDELMTSTSGDFENSNCQGKFGNEIVHHGHQFSTIGQGTNQGEPTSISNKCHDQMNKSEGRSLLESKADERSAGYTGANGDTSENVKTSFESSSSVVCDGKSSHFVDSINNGNHGLMTNRHCKDAKVKGDLRVCSSCHRGSKSHSTRSDKSCEHFYCVSCICQHFGEWKCPVCDIGDSTSNQIISQPVNGTMLIAYDGSFKLPGFENDSRGTIIVTYAFPSGIQSAELPKPGQFYSSFTATSFFPLCLEGSRVVDLLHRAFENRLVFRISQSEDESNGKLAWNGIHHKVNIYGGFQQEGYPDPNYLKQICNDLAAKGIREAE